MYQQYLTQAVRTLQNLSSDDLKELLNDDDKLNERVDQAVSIRIQESDLSHPCDGFIAPVFCSGSNIGIGEGRHSGRKSQFGRK